MTRRPRPPFYAALAAIVAVLVAAVTLGHLEREPAYPGYSALPPPATITAAFDVVPRAGGTKVPGALIPVPLFSGADELYVGPGGVLVCFSGPGALPVTASAGVSPVRDGVYAVVTHRRHGRLVVWPVGQGYVAVVLWGDRRQLGIATAKLAGLLVAELGRR